MLVSAHGRHRSKPRAPHAGGRFATAALANLASRGSHPPGPVREAGWACLEPRPGCPPSSAPSQQGSRVSPRRDHGEFKDFRGRVESVNAPRVARIPDSGRGIPCSRAPVRGGFAAERLRRRFLCPGPDRSARFIGRSRRSRGADRPDHPRSPVHPDPRSRRHPRRCRGKCRLADRPELGLRMRRPRDLRPAGGIRAGQNLAFRNDPAGTVGCIPRCHEPLPGLILLQRYGTRSARCSSTARRFTGMEPSEASRPGFPFGFGRPRKREIPCASRGRAHGGYLWPPPVSSPRTRRARSGSAPRSSQVRAHPTDSSLRIP